MKKWIYILLIGSSLLYANNNIDNSGGSFINNGIINNTQTNNYEGEKAKFDTRIAQFSSETLNNSKNNIENSIILSSASRANNYNISIEEKREKCIEHAVSVSFIKIDIGYARKECTKIFN